MEIPGINTQNYEMAINGELTFFGVLATFYEEISARWGKDETKEVYGMHFQEFILPHFEGRPLREFDNADMFLEIVEMIRKKGTLRSKGHEEYGESTIQHFKYLIRKVVEVAAKHGVCPHSLWGSDFRGDDRLGEDPYTKKEGVRLQLPRSIDPIYFVQILSLLLTNPQQDGVQMALLLMCIFGLRNKEACSVWWEDIEEIPNHPGCYVLVVHSTAEGRELYRRSGGKTISMYRKIPIPPEAYEFLMARKSYVLRKLLEQKAECSQNILHLPIACNRDVFWEHCLPAQITAAGREVFRRVGFSEDAFYAAEIESGEDDSGFPGMKSPTAYTFRREYCTARYALGYTMDENAYTMGHKISNALIRRRYFSNPDNLYTLWKKAAAQPLLNMKSVEKPIEMFTGKSLCLENVFATSVDLSNYSGGNVRIRVATNEPNDAPVVTICTENVVCYDLSQQKSIRNPEKEVNILYDYYYLHRRALEQMKRK